MVIFFKDFFFVCVLENCDGSVSNLSPSVTMREQKDRTMIYFLRKLPNYTNLNTSLTNII